jgi:hypothetical protein
MGRKVTKIQHARWGGLNPHPVIASIDKRLQEQSFSFAYGDTDETGYHWTKLRSDGDGIFFHITPPGFGRLNQEGFGILIGIESLWLTEVQNKVCPWECGLGLIAPDAFPLRTPSWILLISLHWLLLNAEPAIERLS